jgi:hypothetical protein
VSDIKPLLGFPTERTGTVNGETLQAMARIWAQGWPQVWTDYGRIDLTRCRMAQELLKSTCTHLIMLDADHIHPPDVVHKLLRWAATDRDKYQIVGGLNYRRGEPYEALAFLRDPETRNYFTYEDWPEGLHQVAALGTGSICIDRRVFEALPAPWFAYAYPQKYTDDGSFGWPTDDTYFAQLCEKHGISQWVDTTVTSPHGRWVYVDKQYGDEYRARQAVKTEV